MVFEDPKFFELQREYKNKDILSTQLLDKDTNKILESALRDDVELMKDLDLGDDLQIQGKQKNLNTQSRKRNIPESIFQQCLNLLSQIKEKFKKEVLL